jgi:hypothetical protein
MQVLGTTTKRAEAGAPDIPVVVTSRRLMTADIVRLTLGDPQQVDGLQNTYVDNLRSAMKRECRNLIIVDLR